MSFRNLATHLLLITLVVISATSVSAQNRQDETNNDTLSVGLAGNEPFVFEDENRGIASEIWDEIADSKDWDYKYVSFDNVEDALHSLKRGDLDLVVGPISITSSRLENMRFSQPFYNSSISILSRVESRNLWERIKPLLSLKLLIAIGAFLVILAIVGSLLWLAERKESPQQFPNGAIKGIGTGMWLAIVTMTTTGYGDKAPVTLLGRVITGAWMVISIIFATSMVAGIASILTLSTLDTTTIANIEQLSGRKAATISGSPSEHFLKTSDVQVTGVADLEEAFDKLMQKSVDAIVYDRPQLLYYLKNHNKEELYISKAEYYKQGYGFAFPEESELIFSINRTLLELAENQEKDRIIDYYIEKDE